MLALARGAERDGVVGVVGAEWRRDYNKDRLTKGRAVVAASGDGITS